MRLFVHLILGNKCFKLVVKSYEEGVTWGTALDLCRAEPGIAPDLASILSEYENGQCQQSTCMLSES